MSARTLQCGLGVFTPDLDFEAEGNLFDSNGRTDDGHDPLDPEHAYWVDAYEGCLLPEEVFTLEAEEDEFCVEACDRLLGSSKEDPDNQVLGFDRLSRDEIFFFLCIGLRPEDLESGTMPALGRKSVIHALREFDDDEQPLSMKAQVQEWVRRDVKAGKVTPSPVRPGKLTLAGII